MGFWQWAGQFAIAGVSCGVAIFLLRWWKEARDRKARKHSYHAKALLQQADQICGIARAASAVAADKPGSEKSRPQASILWKSSSTSSLLNVWLANAWILDKCRKTRPFRQRFQDVVEELRQTAIAWHEADMKWRKVKGITENERLLGGDQAENNSPEAADRLRASQALQESVEKFLTEFQAFHHVLQPIVREYISRPEKQEDPS